MPRPAGYNDSQVQSLDSILLFDHDHDYMPQSSPLTSLQRPRKLDSENAF
jgi:hypothetical protein